MPTVTFQNGKTATFQGDPTPQDVEFVAKQMGVPPATAQANPATQGFKNYSDEVIAARNSGIGQVVQGFDQFSDAGMNPAKMLEGGLTGAAGVVNTVLSPISPLFKPIGTAVDAVSDKILDSPGVQKFAASPAGQAVAHGAEDVQNLSTVAGGEAGAMAIAGGDAEAGINASDSFPAKPLADFPDQAIDGVKTKVYTSPADQIRFQEHSLYNTLQDSGAPAQTGISLPQAGVEGRIADYAATLNKVSLGMGDMWKSQFNGVDLSKITPEQMTTITNGAADLADSPVAAPGATKAQVSEGDRMTIQARTDTYNQLASKSTAVEDAINAGKAKGFDPVADLASDDRFTPEVSSDGRIDSSTAIKNLNDFVKPIAAVERQAIIADGRSFSFAKFASDVRGSLSQYKARGSSYDAMVKRVDADLAVYQREYAQNGTISGVSLDDIKNAKYSISNWNDEDAQISDKSVARVAKETIYNGTKNADLKQLNTEMSRYYSARDVLDAVDNKIVRGGRLGKYFARTLGTAIGSHFGPIGALVGMYTGDALEGAAMQHQFNPLMSGIMGKGSLETPTPTSVANTTEALAQPKGGLPAAGQSSYQPMPQPTMFVSPKGAVSASEQEAVDASANAKAPGGRIKTKPYPVGEQYTPPNELPAIQLGRRKPPPPSSLPTIKY